MFAYPCLASSVKDQIISVILLIKETLCMTCSIFHEGNHAFLMQFVLCYLPLKFVYVMCRCLVLPPSGCEHFLMEVLESMKLIKDSGEYQIFIIEQHLLCSVFI